MANRCVSNRDNFYFIKIMVAQHRFQMYVLVQPVCFRSSNYHLKVIIDTIIPLISTFPADSHQKLIPALHDMLQYFVDIVFNPSHERNINFMVDAAVNKISIISLFNVRRRSSGDAIQLHLSVAYHLLAVLGMAIMHR